MFRENRRDSKADDSKSPPNLFGQLLIHGMPEGKKPWDYDSEGMTLFHEVAISGETVALKPILECGADPNQKVRANSLLKKS